MGTVHNQRTRINTIEGAREAMAQVNKGIKPPKGVVFKSQEEALIWEQYSRARLADDWRTMDLLLLAKVVKLEVDIRKNEDMLAIEGVVIPAPSGYPMENPRFRAVNTLQVRQLAIIRALSLNAGIGGNAEAGPKNKRGKKVSEAAHDKENNSDGLLAQGPES